MKAKKMTHAPPALEPLDVQFIEQPTPIEERDPCKPPVREPANQAERSVRPNARQPAKSEERSFKPATTTGKLSVGLLHAPQRSLSLLQLIDVENMLHNPGDFLLCTPSLKKGHSKYCLWVKSTDDRTRNYAVRRNEKEKYYAEGQRRDFVSQKERSTKAVKSKRTSRERDVPSASSKKTAKKCPSSHRQN